jgi:hypothetical protein
MAQRARREPNAQVQKWEQTQKQGQRQRRQRRESWKKLEGQQHGKDQGRR